MTHIARIGACTLRVTVIITIIWWYYTCICIFCGQLIYFRNWFWPESKIAVNCDQFRSGQVIRSSPIVILSWHLSHKTITNSPVFCVIKHQTNITDKSDKRFRFFEPNVMKYSQELNIMCFAECRRTLFDALCCIRHSSLYIFHEHTHASLLKALPRTLCVAVFCMCVCFVYGSCCPVVIRCSCF